MGNLFVVGFDEPNQGEEVHFKLQKLQSDGLLDLADVAVESAKKSGVKPPCGLVPVFVVAA